MNSPQKTILLIDDDSDIRKTLVYALEAEGYNVYSSEDGESGIAKLTEIKADLILLDLILPGEDGYRVAQKVKLMKGYADIPIVALSAKHEDIDKYVAAKSGILGYLEKPIDLDKLFFYLEDIFNK